MWSGQIRHDAVGQKKTAASNAVPDPSACTTEPKNNVIPYVHAAGKTHVELTFPERQKCTAKQNPVRRKGIVFSPTIEVLCPRHADWNEFVHNFLSFQKGNEAFVDKEGDSRRRKVPPQILQKWHKDSKIAQIPILDHEDAGRL